MAGASSDAESPTARAQASLPPQWVDFADKAKEDIKEIRDQLVQLTKAQQKRLSRTNVGIDAPDHEVEAISAAIATHIRVCEQSIHQVRSFGNKSNTPMLDDEFRQNTQRSLAAQLQQLSKQCRESQKEYMQEVKRRKKQQHQQQMLHLAGGGAGGAHNAVANHTEGLTQTQLLELEHMEDFAAQRSSEVAQIALSIEELNRIFRELAILVIDQGSILDRIDYNTEKIYKKSDDGRKQMEKAVKTKRTNDSRAWWCFVGWASADALALLILLVKWHLKYGLKNVLIFVSCVAALGAAVWFGWKCLQPIFCPKLTGLSSIIPERWDPSKIWKRIRPGPVNAAKAAAAAGAAGMRGGGGEVSVWAVVVSIEGALLCNTSRVQHIPPLSWRYKYPYVRSPLGRLPRGRRPRGLRRSRSRGRRHWGGSHVGAGHTGGGRRQHALMRRR